MTTEDLALTHKFCTVCNTYKLLESFSKHSDGCKQGLRSQCKSCCADKNKIWYDEKVKDPDFIEKQRQKYSVQNLKRDQKTEYNSEKYLRYKEKNKDRLIARDKVHKAIDAGKIFKKPCEKCGNIKSEAHHEDYTKPLDVIWLCRIHHAEIHRKQY